MVRCYTGIIKNDRGRTSYQSARRAHRRGDVSRGKEFVRNQTGRRGGDTPITGFIEHDPELAEFASCITSNDTVIMAAMQTTPSKIPEEEKLLYARTTLSIRRRNRWVRAGVGQLPRLFDANGRAGGSNNSLDRQPALDQAAVSALHSGARKLSAVISSCQWFKP